MNERDIPSSGSELERSTEPDYLQNRETLTQSIDLDRLFTKDVTTSGSFDLRRIRDISFGKLLEAIPIATVLIDSDQKIIFSNQAVGKVSSGAANLLGVDFPSLFVDEIESWKAWTAIDDIFRDRRTRILEGLLRINNTALWCRVHLRSVRFRNQRSVIALVEDLTAEKRQLILNEKYQQLVQIFPIGIAEFSLKMSVSIHAPVNAILSEVADAELFGGNYEFAGMHGSPDIVELRGSKLSKLFPFEDQHLSMYRAWIEDGFPVRSFETEESGEDSVVRYFENTLVGNVKNESLVGLWGMRQDISARKESEAALRAARDKLEEKVKERTAELSHANEQLLTEISVRRQAERQLETMVEQLQEALTKVKTLSGLLPICASCKKIRDDRGYWTQVEVYVREHSEADFTHSICPECAAKLYPDFYNPNSFGGGR